MIAQAIWDASDPWTPHKRKLVNNARAECVADARHFLMTGRIAPLCEQLGLAPHWLRTMLRLNTTWAAGWVTPRPPVFHPRYEDQYL